MVLTKLFDSSTIKELENFGCSIISKNSFYSLKIRKRAHMLLRFP
jgi:hypothetical protein